MLSRVKIQLLAFLLSALVFAPAQAARFPAMSSNLLVVAQAAVNCPGPANAPDSAQENLDHTEDDWGVFCEKDPEWQKQNVATPAVDGKSLECAITGGASYSNVHCYRNLINEPDAAMFTLDLTFWFTATTCNNIGGDSVVQALEFTMNKWYQEQRYEFAVQWQNVGDGGPQWRYWDPTQLPDERWVAFSPTITQCLQGGNNKKHTLRMEGAIVSEQVELRSFTIDGTTHTVNLTIPAFSDSSAPDILAVAVQVDGNADETPYSLFIDQVHFIRWPGLLTLASPADGSVTATQQPTLSWNAVPGAVRYEVQLDTVNPPRVSVANSNTLSFTPAHPLTPTAYYWRVRAVNGSGHASPWTHSRCMMVQSPLTGTPQLNFFTTRTPTLTWAGSTWATAYEVQIDNTKPLSAPMEYNIVVPDSTLTVTSSPLHDCIHYWRVRAKRSNNLWGDWSAVNSFVLDAP